MTAAVPSDREAEIDKATLALRKNIHTERALKALDAFSAETRVRQTRLEGTLQQHVDDCEIGQKALRVIVDRIEKKMDTGFSAIEARVASLETLRIEEQTAEQKARDKAEGRAEFIRDIRRWCIYGSIPVIAVAGLTHWLSEGTTTLVNLGALHAGSSSVTVKQTSTGTP